MGRKKRRTGFRKQRRNGGWTPATGHKGKTGDRKRSVERREARREKAGWSSADIFECFAEETSHGVPDPWERVRDGSTNDGFHVIVTEREPAARPKTRRVAPAETLEQQATAILRADREREYAREYRRRQRVENRETWRAKRNHLQRTRRRRLTREELRAERARAYEKQRHDPVYKAKAAARAAAWYAANRERAAAATRERRRRAKEFRE